MTEWVRGEVEQCHWCLQPVHLRTGGAGLDGHGYGHPMMETYVHYVCPNVALQQRVSELLAKLYESESVLWALRRIERVGDLSVDPEGDRKHYETRWAAWNQALDAL